MEILPAVSPHPNGTTFHNDPIPLRDMLNSINIFDTDDRKCCALYPYIFHTYLEGTRAEAMQT